MAKDILFKVYDLRRENPKSLASPPSKITSHRMSKEEWARTGSAASAVVSGPSKVTKSRRKGRKTAKKPIKKAPRTAAGVLRCTLDEVMCLHCGRTGDERECGAKCSREFRKVNFLPSSAIDIRGPGELGYGAWTAPNVTIKKGQWLEEYLGDLRPLPTNLDAAARSSDSLYRIWIPETAIIDAEKAGNWTRFINSSCRPNVKPWGEFVGKRHVVLFQALRDIGPEEELVFQYGAKWFEKAGFLCRCGVSEEAHMPGEKGKGKGNEGEKGEKGGKDKKRKSAKKI